VENEFSQKNPDEFNRSAFSSLLWLFSSEVERNVWIYGYFQMKNSSILMGKLITISLIFLTGNSYAGRFAEVTLLYDDAGGEKHFPRLFIAGNWNKDTGQYQANWQDFERFKMFDDGLHNDGKAGDHIWGYITKIAPEKGQKSEWAVDNDANKSNGWLGSGTPFYVEDSSEKTVTFRQNPQQKAGNIIDKASAPRAVQGGVLFTFKAEDVHKVYLAGNFNNWADNDQGEVTNPEHEMLRGKNGVWYKIVKLRPKIYKYKLVTADINGKCSWHSDPFISEKDGDENSVVDFSALLTVSKKRKLVKGRELKTLAIDKIKRDTGNIHIKKIRAQKIWVRPGENTKVTVHLSNLKQKTKNTVMVFSVKTFNNVVKQKKIIKDFKESMTFDIKTKGFKEGGYILECKLKENNKVIDKKFEVLSVVKDISDDLRYGFYANWDKMGTDYDKKTDYFARLHINAIEYYDYFPAHGYYAPKEKEYEYEPFGIKILGQDIQNKINSANKRNILSIAYVAAYSASQSIYKKYPYPMTDKNGEPRIFNGSIMTESEAKKGNKDIWFYLMAIARDTKWYSYIMEEFKRVLDDSPDDIVSFDGFEIDSYGHACNEKYYSKGSKYSGRILSKIIMDLVGDVRKLTHKMKKNAVVSFNCVNEYSIKDMYDVVDFLFIENWSGFKSYLEDIVDLCYTHRRPKNQRVIIKVYPADTKLKQKNFRAQDLKYILAATMTGGGSLMVAGEPDEINGEMHALNTLFYPDNAAMPQENFEILRNYYIYDALLYRFTHGKNVSNIETDFELPGCIIRAFETDEDYIVINILHNGKNYEWNRIINAPGALENYEIAFKMPDTKKPAAKVLYGTPDCDELLIPRELDWEFKDGYVRALIPKLQAFGTLLIKCE